MSAAAAAGPSETARKPSRFNQHLHSVSTKVGWPLNKAANLVGGEGWWPTNMEKECSKAARILHSFTSKLPPPVFNLHEKTKQKNSDFEKQF
jgi:hypothetical protein